MSTVIATRVRSNLRGFTGVAHLWRLSPPVAHGGGLVDYVVTSATLAAYSGPETYIFPANPDGKVSDWGEMSGSYRGGLDHEQAIRNSGWLVEGDTP